MTNLIGISGVRGSAARANMVDCPKCGGTGHLRAFSHIANGDCYACGAVGKVSATAATPAQAAYSYPAKVVETEIGQLSIERFGQGFTAWHKDGQVWFSVKAGRVCAVEVSTGVRGFSRCKVREVLQRAYKG